MIVKGSLKSEVRLDKPLEIFVGSTYSEGRRSSGWRSGAATGGGR